MLVSACADLSSEGMKKVDFWEFGNFLCGLFVGVRDFVEGMLCCFDYNCVGDIVC